MKKLLSFSNLYFLYIFLTGLVFVFLVPPFQKPDEENHFYRAVSLSSGQFFCNKDENSSYFKIPEKYFLLSRNLNSSEIHFDYNKKFLYKNLYVNSRDENSVDKIMRWEKYCNLPFTTYIIFVPSVLVGNILGSSLISFYLCRLVLAIIFIFSIVWSYRRLANTRFRWVVVFYSLIPIVVQQVTSIGYDYVQLSIAPILFALIVAINKKDGNKKDFIIFCLLMFILQIAKPGYYLFSLVYFLIPRNLVAKDIKSYLVKTSIYLMLCFIPGIAFARLYSGAFVTPSLFNPSLQLDFLRDPLFTYTLFINTFNKYSDFYFKSSIGLLGWLDYGLPYYFYLLPLVVFGLLSGYLYKDSFFKNTINKFFILGLSIFSTILFIFLTVYLSWNSIGSREIVGIQGRYFVMFIPFLILFFSSAIRMLHDNKTIRKIAFVVFGIVMLNDIIFAVYNRYYNYSGILGDPTHAFSLSKENNENNFKTIKESQRFIVKLDKNRKIGSLGFYQKPSKLPMQMAYKYRLMDSNCNTVLRKGYFDTNMLQAEGVYEEKTGILKTDSENMCVEISPFISNDERYNYMKLLSSDGQYIFFRYIQN